MSFARLRQENSFLEFILDQYWLYIEYYAVCKWKHVIAMNIKLIEWDIIKKFNWVICILEIKIGLAIIDLSVNKWLGYYYDDDDDTLANREKDAEYIGKKADKMCQIDSDEIMKGENAF